MLASGVLFICIPPTIKVTSRPSPPFVFTRLNPTRQSSFVSILTLSVNAVRIKRQSSPEETEFFVRQPWRLYVNCIEDKNQTPRRCFEKLWVSSATFDIQHLLIPTAEFSPACRAHSKIKYLLIILCVGKP